METPGKDRTVPVVDRVDGMSPGEFAVLLAVMALLAPCVAARAAAARLARTVRPPRPRWPRSAPRG